MKQSNPSNYVLWLLMVGFWLTNAVAASDTPQIPVSGKNINVFIPAGWHLEKKLEADLDGSNGLDELLVLTDKNAAVSNTQDGNRILLLLLKTDSGYKLAGLGRHTLWCLLCYGSLGGSEGGAPEITVDNKHVIKIYQSGGDSEALDIILKFRFEKDTGRFRLIGKDTIARERLSGNVQTISINYLSNKKKVGEVMFDNFGQNEQIKDREERIATIKIYIENYNIDDF